MASSITASSAIDVQGMVASLMQVERRPLAQMQAEAKKIDTKISAFGKLQSQIAAFRDAAATLARLDTWRAVKASSGSPDVVEATAGPGAGAGQHEITVQKLAASQTVASGAFAAADSVVGGGTLRIQLGSQPSGPTSFTADAARPEVSVTVAAGATLTEVRDAINASNAGVRASLVRDGAQVRLFVTGAASGGDQAFRIVADDLDGNGSDAAGLSALSFEPTAPAVGTMALKRTAADAEYTLDGVALTAGSNRIAGAMDGMDLVLRQETATPVQVDVTVDTEALEAAAKKFVEAYNGLNKLLAEQTKYDEATKTAGPLQGDRSAVGIMGQVRSIVREEVTGGTLTRLSDVGIRMQRDGSLQLDAEDFRSAATDPTRLERLFAAAGTTEADKGLMLRFRDLGDRLIGADGSVQTATDAWQARLTTVKRRQDAFEARMSDVEKRLLRQYTSLDAQLAAAQQTSASLGSALAGLPKLG